MHQASEIVLERVHLASQVRQNESCKLVFRILIITMDDDKLIIALIFSNNQSLCASYLI